LNKVTMLARWMVTQYGMSDQMGPMVFGQRQQLIFLGRDIGEQRNYSEQVAREIDTEVNRIVTEAYNRAKALLTQYSDLHRTITKRLMEAETLDDAEFEAFFAGVPGIPPRKVEPTPSPETPAPSRPTNTPVQGLDRPTGGPTPWPAPA
jgi:cell division protease FtsH